jgi:hypothetical protein
MDSIFTYLGKKYKPLRQLRGRGRSLSYIGRNINTDYTGTPDGYNHTEFYKEATKNGCATIDIFQCVDDKQIIIPCNIMYIWKGEV